MPIPDFLSIHIPWTSVYDKVRMLRLHFFSLAKSSGRLRTRTMLRRLVELRAQILEGDVAVEL